MKQSPDPQISGSHWQTLFEDGLDAILILDHEGRCRRANPAAQALLSPLYGALEGRHVTDFTPPAVGTTDWWRGLLQSGQGRGTLPLALGQATAELFAYSFVADLTTQDHILILQAPMPAVASAGSVEKLAPLERRTAPWPQERDRVVEALFRESEERLFEILHSAGAAIASFRFLPGQPWQFDYFSAGCERLYGYSPTALMAEPHLWRSRVHPEDGQTQLEACTDCIQLEQTFSLEFRFQHRDGTWQWIAGSYSSRINPEGDGWVVTMVNFDISDRKQLEMNLRQQRDFVQRLTDASPQLIYIFALAEERIIYSNHRQFAGFLGLAEDAVDLPTLVQRWHPEDWARLQQMLPQAQHLTDQDHLYLDYRLRHQDGSWRWLQSQMVVFERDGEGNPTKLLGTAIDISDRKDLELRLQASEAQLNQVLNNARAAIRRFHFHRDHSLDYLYCSEGAQAVYGYAAEEFLADPALWLDQIYPDDLDTLVAPKLPQIFKGQSFRLEYRFRTESGALRWISEAISAQPSETDDSWVVTTVATDITEDKRAAAALIQSYQLYEDLLNSVDGIVWELEIPTMQFIFVSQQAKEILGYPLWEWYDDSEFWQRHIYPADRQKVLRYCAEEIRHLRSHDFEYRMVAADGRIIWLRNIVNVVVDQGLPTRLRGLMIDITAAKTAENQLQRYQRIVSATPDGIVLINRDYVYQLVNQCYLDWYNCQNSDIIGYSVADWLGKEVFESLVKPRLDRALAGEVVRYQAWFTYPGIGHQFMQITYAPYYDAADDLEGVVASLRIITDLKRAEIALQQQAEQDYMMAKITNHIRQSLNLQEILDTAVADIRQYLQVDRALVYRCHHDYSGRVIAEALDPSWPSLLGQVMVNSCAVDKDSSLYQAKGCVQNVADVSASDLPAREVARLTALQVKADLVLPIQDSQQVWGMLEMQHCESTRVWQPEEISFLQRFSDQLAIAIQQSELYGKLEAANQRLYHQATHDRLTAIPNRRYFDQWLAQEWKRAARDQTMLSLVICDVDYFKPYNDHYGHPAGDECLQQIADVLDQSVHRPADLAARYGGEEFVLVLPDTDAAGAIQIVKQIQLNLQRRHLAHEASPIADVITLSFGIACDCPQPNTSPVTIIERADAALYQAKQAGRDRYGVAD